MRPTVACPVTVPLTFRYKTLCPVNDQYRAAFGVNHSAVVAMAQLLLHGTVTDEVPELSTVTANTAQRVKTTFLKRAGKVR